MKYFTVEDGRVTHWFHDLNSLLIWYKDKTIPVYENKGGLFWENLGWHLTTDWTPAKVNVTQLRADREASRQTVNDFFRRLKNGT